MRVPTSDSDCIQQQVVLRTAAACPLAAAAASRTYCTCVQPPAYLPPRVGMDRLILAAVSL